MCLFCSDNSKSAVIAYTIEHAASVWCKLSFKCAYNWHCWMLVCMNDIQLLAYPVGCLQSGSGVWVVWIYGLWWLRREWCPSRRVPGELIVWPARQWSFCMNPLACSRQWARARNTCTPIHWNSSGNNQAIVYAINANMTKWNQSWLLEPIRLEAAASRKSRARLINYNTVWSRPNQTHTL
jgi:hypothetical protein